MPNRTSTVSIVGSETAVGRDLREQLAETGFRKNIQLIGAEDEIAGILTQHEGEPVVMTPLDSGRLQESFIVFCAGSPESTRRAHSLLPGDSRPKIIDLTYALEELPDARLRAPMIEPEGYPLPEDSIHVIAHPAALATAMILLRLQDRHAIRHSVVQILEPVSERGLVGMNELQQQTTALLSFQTLNKTVFDAQAGFNVLPRYGEDAPVQLHDVETRIDRHIASLLATHAVPMPSLRLVQAPVFHGYSLSFWIEFESRPAIAEIGETLASALIEVRDPELDAPNNVSSVGQPGIIVGAIEADRNQPQAIWLWAVADNFRLLTDNAIAVARTLGAEKKV